MTIAAQCVFKSIFGWKIWWGAVLTFFLLKKWHHSCVENDNKWCSFDFFPILIPVAQFQTNSCSPKSWDLHYWRSCALFLASYFEYWHSLPGNCIAFASSSSCFCLMFLQDLPRNRFVLHNFPLTKTLFSNKFICFARLQECFRIFIVVYINPAPHHFLYHFVFVFFFNNLKQICSSSLVETYSVLPS